MKKIMVVDDEEDLGTLVKKTLEKTGLYEVTYISRSEQVLGACRENPPDLILLDLVMPNLSGQELIKALKGSPETKKIIIVVTSGLGEMVYVKKNDSWKWQPNRPVLQQHKGELIKEKSSERAAQAYGVDGYLAKPFAPATLLEVVAEILDEAEKHSAPPADSMES